MACDVLVPIPEQEACPIQAPLTGALNRPSGLGHSPEFGGGAMGDPVSRRAWPPRSAYLHIPFCHRRCFYCDFAVVPLGDHADGAESGSIAAYLELLLGEIAAAPAGPPLSTVYVGGGTPSMLTPSQLGSLLAALAARFGLAPGAEISLEMDPASFDGPRLAGYLAAGVNRVSLGGQSFDDGVLERLGRRHRRSDLLQAASWLDQARQGDAVVAKILMEEESRSSESLIVRNLENFQGDQRDIMVISCTYGPEYPGTDKVHQRFRSINGTAGKRRFNVAITRAKQQMVVFSSIRSEQVLVGEGKNEGVTDFYKFLRYCEADRRTAVPDLGEETGNAMDSPFEEAVAEFLRSKGYDVEPQVGVCGYFIDLGIRHPQDKGRFALGIECDGATYHSSRAARDRDYLRESILRDRDWEIHRIWSTDWFYEQVKAKQALLRAVREACS